MNNWWDGTDTLPLGGDLWAVPVGNLWGAAGGDWGEFQEVDGEGAGEGGRVKFG